MSDEAVASEVLRWHLRAGWQLRDDALTFTARPVTFEPTSNPYGVGAKAEESFSQGLALLLEAVRDAWCCAPGGCDARGSRGLSARPRVAERERGWGRLCSTSVSACSDDAGMTITRWLPRELHSSATGVARTATEGAPSPRAAV
jgi:hypothetical protein